MNDRFGGWRANSRAIARAVSLAGLLLGSLPPPAAAVERRTAAALKARASVLDDMETLSTVRPRKCAAEKEPISHPSGWRDSPAQCAWQNRLQMRRWTADNSDPASCTSRQAQWWAWMRSRIPAQTGPVAWNDAWAAQSLIDESAAQERVAIIQRAANGSWTATEWTWTPSPRAATRNWQAGRWKLLTDAAMDIRQAARRDVVPPETALLKATWEKNLNGRPGEVAGESWRWERDGLCMRMETLGLTQAQVHLPYSREDGRLEQRAAMQLRLARTYPKATWLTPFRLLPLPDSAARGGAKYEAIWVENTAVKGQLWMPGKADGAIHRARIAVALPANKEHAPDGAAINRIARSIDHELIDFASTWTLAHEQ